MTPTRGVLYVAYGKPARDQFVIATRALARRHPRWPIVVICDEPIRRRRGMPAFECIHYDSDHLGARDAKLGMDLLSPFDWTLYMDVDTRCGRSLADVWRILGDGWEVAAVPTGSKTRTGAMRHVFLGAAPGVAVKERYESYLLPKGLEERNVTVAECGGWPICGIQGGFFAFRRTPAVTRFFEVWRSEWERYRDQDQPALARAYRKSPVKWFPLGYYWNGGAGLGHYHSHARRPELKGSIH